jgi:hypothetical protein
MEWIAAAIFLAGWWISDAISDLAASASDLNDTIESLVIELIEKEE